MGYTHNRGFSAITDGYAVGAKSAERKIINGSGYITVPQIDKAGAPVFTKLASGTTAANNGGGTGTATFTNTLTATTITVPANGFVKWKAKSVIGAAVSTYSWKLMAGTQTIDTATKTTGSATKLTTTRTPVVATGVPASAAWKIVAKQVLKTSATIAAKKLTLVSLNIQKPQKLWLQTIT
jgi:hypothetical protein